MCTLTSSCLEDSKLVQRLDFNYQFTIDGKPISLDENYILNGSTVMFEVAHYYIHGLRMTNTASEVMIALDTDYLLAGPSEQNFIKIEDINPTTISKTRIIVGVDAESNAQRETDFTERSIDDPLGLKDPSMHWNWNSGYKFIRFDGKVDTDNDGIVDTPIAYHIGTDAFRKTLELDTDLELDANSNTLIFSFDLNQFFTNVDFQIEKNWDTHTANNIDLAELLTANLDGAISLSK